MITQRITRLDLRSYDQQVPHHPDLLEMTYPSGRVVAYLTRREGQVYWFVLRDGEHRDAFHHPIDDGDDLRDIADELLATLFPELIMEALL